MLIKEKTKQNNTLNNPIVPENQTLLNPVSHTQKKTEQYEAVKKYFSLKGS